MSTMREASKQPWETHRPPTLEQINAGSLQRIADATEKMAASYDQMRNARDYWQAEYERVSADRSRLQKQVQALRGVITRMKNKAAQQPEQQ